VFNVLDCVWTQHDHRLVALAAVICLIGCLTSFLLTNRARECGPKRRGRWLTITAVAAGVGVWSTHFIAMLAYDGGLPIAFGLELTLLSVAVAIGVFWVALRVLYAIPSAWACVLAGFAFSLGVAAMHMVGMSAIQASARIHYDIPTIAIGALISSGLAAASFLVFATVRKTKGLLASTGLLVLSICTLHFTGMSATTLIPDPTIIGPTDPAAGRDWLISAVVIASVGAIALTALAAFVDRYLTDLRGLADATREGLMIVRCGRIIEVNERITTLSGRTGTDLIGKAIDSVFVPANGSLASAVGVAPVEGVLASDQPEGAVFQPDASEGRPVEAVAHTIEYRGRQCQVLAIRDLTDKKEAQRQIEHLARNDVLTGLSNRATLDERMEEALTRARRGSEALAVLALDLDRFKAVNDIFGHAQGDQILCKVAEILKTCVRSSDTIARIGGDEFVILQSDGPQPKAARALCDRILTAFAEEMDTTRDPAAVGVSIGVAIYPDDAIDGPALRKGADVALYRAKQSGRGVACFFDHIMDAEVRARRELEHDLRHAVLRQQLHVAYQPLVSTKGGDIGGYEALLRWSHPVFGEIGPDIFIPIAEESGSIIQLGEWVLREACATAATWPDHLSIAVNVSTVQFQVPNLVELVEAVLAESGLAAERLELEITESVLMRDRVMALRTLNRLKDLGVAIVMDDFGTGYSSLNNLQSFPFDKIKIDRSFILALENDEAARSIVRAIVGLGRSLNLPVVAEGVETEAQHRMVTDEGCPQAQGFLFGRPVSAPQFEPAIKSQITAKAS